MSILQRWKDVKRLLLYNGSKVRSAGVDESVLCCDELSPESKMPMDNNCALFEFIKQYSVKEIEKLIYNTLETIQNTTTDQDRNDTKVQSRLCKL